MLKPSRKKVLILSITLIAILSMLTIYELNNSSYYLERALGNKIDFSTFNGDRYIGVSYAKEEYLLINDNDDWIDFLNHTYHSPHQISPINESQFYLLLESVQLNFSEKIYFGAFWGYKPTGGHHIEIKDLVLDGRDLTVYIERSHPEGMATSVITYPHHIIAINKEDIPSNVSVIVKFQENNNFYLIPVICIIATIMISITFFKITQKHGNGERDNNPLTKNAERK